MSPPNISLDKKVSEDVSMSIAPEPPQPRLNRAYKWIVLSVIIGALIVVGGIIAAVTLNHRLSEKEDFDTIVNYDGHKLPEHVRVSYKEKIIYVNQERDGELGGLYGLYDYNNKILALKDAVNKKCYIDKTNHSFEDAVKDWKYSQNTERIAKPHIFRYMVQPIDKAVLRSFAGQHISNHCRDQDSHWIIALPRESFHANEKDLKHKTIQFLCQSKDEKPCDPTEITDSEAVQSQSGGRVKRRADDIIIIIITCGCRKR